jgi:hypothetical protein
MRLQCADLFQHGHAMRVWANRQAKLLGVFHDERSTSFAEELIA